MAIVQIFMFYRWGKFQIVEKKRTIAKVLDKDEKLNFISDSLDDVYGWSKKQFSVCYFF